MPLKVNCGLSKKIGQPDYGSLGASCHVEFEAESTLLQTDLEAFHRHVRNAFTVCQQAVNDELARHQPESTLDGRVSRDTQTSPSGNGQRNGNGANGQRASQKQVEYIQQLSRQIHGLGVRRLETLANKMFDKPVADLTSMDASGLIDTLKAIKAGEIDLTAALNGATT